MVSKSKFVMPISLVLVVCSGCSAIRQNNVVTEPTTGARAKIRVISGNVVNVHAYPNLACQNRDSPTGGRVISTATVGFEKTLNGKKIGVPTTAESSAANVVSAEFFAKANEPITFTAFRPTTVWKSTSGNVTTTTTFRDGCSTAFHFKPEENRNYELSFVGTRACEFKLSELNAVNGEVKSAKVETMDSPDCDE